MGFREVNVNEVKEVLRGWLDGVGLRVVAERAGVDRKTARRYVLAAQAAGLDRFAGLGAVTDDVVGAVVAAVRPARPNGHGNAWEELLARQTQITAWVAGDERDSPALSIVKIEELLARSGCVVPYRTLHRFATQRCGYHSRQVTVRVNDGEPGAELQIDFGQMGFLTDPETGRRRKVHALIFTAAYSRHMFVRLSYSQTLAAVIAGCEAAWVFFGGVFKVIIPEYVPRNIFRVLWPAVTIQVGSGSSPSGGQRIRPVVKRPVGSSSWTRTRLGFNAPSTTQADGWRLSCAGGLF